MTVKRKLAAHQNGGAGHSLHKAWGKEGRLGKGAKLLLKERLSLVVTLMGSLTTGTTTQLLRSSPSPRDCNSNTNDRLEIFFGDTETKKQSVAS